MFKYLKFHTLAISSERLNEEMEDEDNLGKGSVRLLEVMVLLEFIEKLSQIPPWIFLICSILIYI